MSEGWVCPKCGKVYAPFVTECKQCNGRKVENAWDMKEVVDKCGDTFIVTPFWERKR